MLGPRAFLSAWREMSAVGLPTSARRVSTFASAAEHTAWLERQSTLPSGFRVGTHTFTFNPRELPEKAAKMTVTLIVLDKPTSSYAAMYTSNAFPGAPVIVGRKRLAAFEPVQAIIVNNKVSNVCAPGGVDDSESLCAALARELKLPSPSSVLPCSTGVIGWKLPVRDMTTALPAAVSTLQSGSVLPAAVGIMTTDMYAKVRSAQVPGTNGGRIVGIAKGAGMIEPNLATMLVFLMTDVDVPAAALRAALPHAVGASFNSLSIDSDESTSDTVIALSSRMVPLGDAPLSGFTDALNAVCTSLADDIVRNGEGVQHVLRVVIRGAPDQELARDVGKAVVNSPLFKCAVAGNDPNVGRLVAAIGKCVGRMSSASTTVSARRAPLDMSRTRISMAGITIFERGAFALSPATEKALVEHMRAAQLWESQPTVAAGAVPLAPTTAGSISRGTTYAAADVSYAPPIAFPPHDRSVEMTVHPAATNTTAGSTTP